MARFWESLQTVFHVSWKNSSICFGRVSRKIRLALYQVSSLHLKTSKTSENVPRNLPDLFRQNHHSTFSKGIRFFYKAFKMGAGQNSTSRKRVRLPTPAQLIRSDLECKKTRTNLPINHCVKVLSRTPRSEEGLIAQPHFILTGNRISKMDPFGRLFLTVILPFSVSKICLANERPSPKPPFCRVLALSTR